MAAPKPTVQGTPSPEKLQPSGAPKARWKASTRFVEFRGRKITIKLVDEDNGFDPSKVAMTATGPMPVSHAHSITMDKDGYVPKTEAEEKALLKLAGKQNGHSQGMSFVVLWENREMPEDQRKAELSASEYRKRNEDLEAQLADRPALEEENRRQAALIEGLEKKLAANQGG